MIYLAMTRSHFYTWLFFLLPLFYYLSLPIAVGDLAVWVAHGRYIIQNGAILYSDIFSVLPTEPLIYPVLVSYIYGLIDQVGGLQLVSLFHKLVFILILHIVFQHSLKELRNPFTIKNIFYILLTFAGLAIYFTDRPAFIALLPLILSYIVIEKNDKFDLRVTALLISILVIWGNLHGSWILLIAMLGWKFLFITDRNNFFRHASILSSLCLATLINPFGYKVWPYLLETASISKLRRIDEWNVTNLYDYFPYAIIFYFTAAVFVYLVVQKIRNEKSLTILRSPAFLLLIMGFVAMRNVGLLSLILLPFLYTFNFLEDSKGVVEKKKHSNLILIIAIGGLCVTQLPYFKTKFTDFFPLKKGSVYDTSAPVKFAEYIKSSTKTGPILNDWEYGSYLLYSLQNRILVDARNIIYRQADYIEFARVLEGENSWVAGAAKYNFQFILLDKLLRQNLIEKIKSSDQWKLALENEDTVLFEKK